MMRGLLRKTRIFIIFAMALNLFFPITAPVQAEGLVNVALNKQVTAYPAEGAQQVTDGISNSEYGSRWIVENGGQDLRDLARLEINLEGTAEIRSIKLYSGFTTLREPPEGGSPADQQTVTVFQIRYLKDGFWYKVTDFTPYVTGYHGSIHEMALNTPIVANRLEFKTVDQPNNYRVLELEAMGVMLDNDPGLSPVQTSILSLGKQVVSNVSGGDDTSTPLSLTDGVTNNGGGANKWFVQNGAMGAHAEIDLEDECTVYSIKMYNGWPTPMQDFQDNLADFRFEYYLNDAWHEIPGASETDFDKSLWNYDLEQPITTSKIRVVSNQSTRFRLREIEIWGVGSQAVKDGGFEVRTSLSDFKVSNPIYRIKGEKIASLVGNEGETIEVELKIVGGQATEVTVFTALYGEENAMQVISYDSAILSGDSDSYQSIIFDITLPDAPIDTHYLQTYVWDNLNSQWSFNEMFRFPFVEVVESAWDISPPWSPTSIEANSGASALELKPTGNGAITSQTVKKMPSESYVLSFYAKGVASFEVEILDENDNVILAETISTATSTEWTKKTLSFTLSTDSAVIINLKDTQAGGIVYVDDFSIEISQ